MNFDLIIFAEFQAVTRRADDEEKGDGKPGCKVAKCPKRNQQILTNLTNFLIGNLTMYCTRNQDFFKVNWSQLQLAYLRLGYPQVI